MHQADQRTSHLAVRVQQALCREVAHGYEQDAARAYNNLFILCVMHHDFARGLQRAQDGIAYCETHGLDVFNVRIRIRRAFAHVVMLPPPRRTPLASRNSGFVSTKVIAPKPMMKVSR